MKYFPWYPAKNIIFTERVQIWFRTCARFECFHKVLKISELEAGYSLTGILNPPPSPSPLLGLIMGPGLLEVGINI